MILLLGIGAAIGSEEAAPIDAADVPVPATTVTETVTVSAPPETVKAKPKTVTKTVVKTKTKTVTKTQQQQPVAPPQPEQDNSAYYANCTEARNAGVTPLRRGDSGYGSHLDRDGDGIACE